MASVFFEGGNFMLETRFVASKCDNCQHENNISLRYFVGLDYNLEESVIAMCQACNKDFVVTFDDSMNR